MYNEVASLFGADIARSFLIQWLEDEEAEEYAVIMTERAEEEGYDE